MEFKEFKQEFQKNFREKTKDVSHLFVADIDPEEVWDLYLGSFPPGTNEIFRERKEFDCSACRHFIKRFGNVVFFLDHKVTSIWDFKVEDPKYQAVLDALTARIMRCDIKDVYVTKDKKIGVDKNYEDSFNGVLTWEHLYLELPDKFVYTGVDTEASVRGKYYSTAETFFRSLQEITIEAIETVLELIYSNTLYKGEEWKEILEQFLKYKKYFNALNISTGERACFAWEKSVEAGPIIGKIRNLSIGTLLEDISKGEELDEAVRKYEAIVAPANYKRSKPIFSKRTLENAKKTIEDLGYMRSLPRKYATLDEIRLEDVNFSNRDSAKRIKGDVFAELEEEIALTPERFSRVDEVPLKKFMEDVLPKAEQIEVLFENRLTPNLVSLIAPVHKDAPSMFKWDNGFSWAYNKNMTDSDIKEAVKNAGGDVTGVLRASLIWNEGKYNKNDFDLHCVTPKYHIYFQHMKDSYTKGELDIDIIDPKEGVPAVENITWPSMEFLEEGVYKIYVKNYTHRGGKDGFRAEIEFNGIIHQFVYNKELRHREEVQVAEVIYTKEGGFKLIEKIPSTMATRDIWGIKTQQFVPVSVIMYSPNHWKRERGIGHKHVFFMLAGCRNPQKPNGFFNEFLSNDLREHRRVFEALGSKMRVSDAEDQLSGVGFSTTKRNEVIVKVIGQSERIIKVKI